MTRLLFVLMVAIGQAPRPTVMDVSALKVGAATTVTELDLGKLKGDLRQLAWSTDANELYVQTVEPQRGGPDKVHHYVVSVAGGPLTTVEDEPQWAATYWTLKSDRSAPGIPSLMIDVEQTQERVKVGTGSAGAADPGGDALGGANINSADNLTRAADSQKANVIRLTLLGEVLGMWINQRPIPGLTFGWGPEESGTIAFVDADGKLMLLDRQKHKQAIAGVRDALLPAWTTDGTHLAYVRKTGRRKYLLVRSDVAR